MANFDPEAQFLHEGNTVDHVAAAAIAAGEVVPLGTTGIGVASAAAVTGQTIGLAVEGVFKMKKQAALAMAVGDLAYWDDTANEIDGTNTNIDAGIVVKAAAAADTHVWVKLVQGGIA